MEQPQIAVLTGDIVRSTTYPAATLEHAMQAIQRAAAGLATLQSPPADPRFTRFRGDGWQIALIKPHLSLRAAVVIQAHLTTLGLATRLCIGIGPADSLGTTDLSDAAGEAFERSGRGLDALSDTARLAIDGHQVREEDRIIADLLDERMGRWTAAQAEATAMQLGKPDRSITLQEIGASLGISAQAVNDRLRGGGGQTIASALRRWEAAKRNQGWNGAS